MKRYLTILLLLFCFFKLQAQTNPSPADSSMHVKLLADSVATKALKASGKVQEILDGAWEKTGFAYGHMSAYDRIMARGGDGIEPSYPET